MPRPDRVLYPDPPITKLDLARYYERIADWIVPHVAGRPLTLVRCPEGIAGGCFYMKHSKVWAPEALRHVKILEKTKVGDYLVADDVAAVVSLVQMGTRLARVRQDPWKDYWTSTQRLPRLPGSGLELPDLSRFRT